MAKGILVVESSPSAPEREAEFNEWYDETHLGEVLAVAGFTAARRYRKLGEGRHPYMAIYEVEADDLGAAVAAMGQAAARGEIQMSDALSNDPPASIALYELLGERRA